MRDHNAIFLFKIVFKVISEIVFGDSGAILADFKKLASCIRIGPSLSLTFGFLTFLKMKNILSCMWATFELFSVN